MQRPTATHSGTGGIWRGQQLAPDSPLYNASECVFIEGHIDLNAFENALRAVLAEAPALTQVFFDTSDGPRQAAGAARPPITVEILTATADPASARQAQIAQDLARTVDLARGPLAQHRLFVENDRVVWYHQAHHIALDGYGFALIAQRVAERYSASIYQRNDRWHFDSFDAVVAEELAYAESTQRQADRDFWLDNLNDRPQPARISSTSAAPVAGHTRFQHTLDATRRAGVEQPAQQLGLSWPDIMLAVTSEWLGEATDRGDIVLGVPMMDRLGSAAARVPTMAMNIVALRVPRRPAASFGQRAADLSQRMAALRAHRRYRYEWLRRDLGLLGGGRRLFGPVVNIMPFDSPLDFAGVPGRTMTVTAGPVDDLAINIRPRGRILSLEFNGHPAGYDTAGLQRHARDWQAILDRVLDDPAQVAPGRAANTKLDSIVSGPDLTATTILPQLLAAQAHDRPDATAIEHGQHRLDYAQLHIRATRLARGLRAHGIRVGDRIAITLPRSIEAIVAIVGAGLADAVWLALKPDAPAARNHAIVDDAYPALVIGAPGDPTAGGRVHVTTEALCARAGNEELPAIAAADPAYLVYTSGSTGTPKGVLISHGALAHFVAGALMVYGIRERDRILQFASLSFDACVEEIYCTLAAGAALVPRPSGRPDAPREFLTWCEAQAITIVDLPTAYWHELVLTLEDATAHWPATLRQVIVGGEAMRTDRLASWHRQTADARVELINTYGPSEATVVATSQRCLITSSAKETSDSVSIGRPLPGMTAAIIDRHGGVVERNVSGELVLSGPALALGYLGRDQATAERFTTLPALGDSRRAYCTGDRVHMDDDGCIHFHGRLDDERKVSGYRVSPGEIEAVLSRCADIADVAVTADGDTLVAHVVSVGAFDARQLRRWLLARLPAPLVPARILAHERLPQTAGGKIDRARLRAGVAVEKDTPAEQMTAMERRVLDVWSAVLDQAGLSPRDDFFALGGTSLQIIQVAQRLGRDLGRDITIGALFEYPFAADLARALAADDGEELAASAFEPLLELRPGRDENTLYCFAPAVGLAWCYTALARLLPDNTRVIGVQSPALAQDCAANDIDGLAEQLSDQLQQDSAGGPYRLLGWSFGGLVAHKVATRLQGGGQTVAQLVLVDAYPGQRWQDRGVPGDAEALAALCQLHPRPVPANLDSRSAILEHLRNNDGPLARLDDHKVARIFDVTRSQLQMAQHARHDRFNGKVLFAGAAMSRRTYGLSADDWRPHVSGPFDAIEFDTDHAGMMRQPAVATLVQHLRHIGEQPVPQSHWNTTEHAKT